MAFSFSNVGITALLAFALPASGVAQQDDAQMRAAITSPNGLPMEALWDYAPEAPDGKLAQTGPYQVSRWGGIVVRGRLDGDKTISALTTVQCGEGKNPGLLVRLLGTPPKDLCKSVTVVAPGRSVLVGVGNDPFMLFGRSTGWTQIDFVQIFGDNNINTGWPPALGKSSQSWGVTKLGAVFRNENGKHIFFAPGETVKLTDRVSFVVKPGMEEVELQAILASAALSKWKN